METRLQKLKTALAVYREQFRSATPLERSVLLMAMRAVMEEVDRLHFPEPRQHWPKARTTPHAA